MREDRVAISAVFVEQPLDHRIAHHRHDFFQEGIVGSAIGDEVQRETKPGLVVQIDDNVIVVPVVQGLDEAGLEVAIDFIEGEVRPAKTRFAFVVQKPIQILHRPTRADQTDSPAENFPRRANLRRGVFDERRRRGEPKRVHVLGNKQQPVLSQKRFAKGA